MTAQEFVGLWGPLAVREPSIMPEGFTGVSPPYPEHVPIVAALFRDRAVRWLAGHGGLRLEWPRGSPQPATLDADLAAAVKAVLDAQV